MSTRLDEKRAADAYASGLWVHSTLADSLREAALTTPTRTVLVDGDIRVDCRTLHARSTALAYQLVRADAGGQRGLVHAAELA